MQTQPQAIFTGHVKRSAEPWKNGKLEFYINSAEGSWTVRLYHNVNPHRVVHQVKSLLGCQAKISYKCGRLIIGDLSDGELHIKVENKDKDNARKLVDAIKSMSVSTPTHSKAEVGLPGSTNGRSSEKHTPNGNSTLSNSNEWLSKETRSCTPAPTTQRSNNGSSRQSSAKRKIQLEPSCAATTPNGDNHWRGNGQTCNGDVYNIDNDESDDEVSFKFTGVKDYSKGQQSKMNGSVTNGFRASSFYGAANTLMGEDAYRGVNWKGGQRPQSYPATKTANKNNINSPKLKRPRLRDLEEGDRENQIVSETSKRIMGRTDGPTLSDPMEGAVGGDVIDGDTGATSMSDGQTVGFDNLGNSCFMNSPLQCLSSLEPLSLDIQSAVSHFGTQMGPNSMTRLLYMLMKDVRRQDVRPTTVKDILIKLRRDINGKFEDNTQQDAHELLAELLDRTDEEVKTLLRNSQAKPEQRLPSTSTSSQQNSPMSGSGLNGSGDSNHGNSQDTSATNGAHTNTDGGTGDDTAPVKEEGRGGEEEFTSTPIQANFTWLYKTSFYFHDCKTEVTSSQNQSDTTLMLALDSKANLNLQDCIDKYFESSEVEVRCNKCGKDEKATMSRKIVKRPRCFILNLLRYQSHNLEAKKKLDRVSIPRYMSVSEFCADDVKAAVPIEPVFMLDREKSLPGLQLTNAECQTKRKEEFQVQEELSFDFSHMINEIELPHIDPPAELTSGKMPPIRVIKPNKYGAIGAPRGGNSSPRRGDGHGRGSSMMDDHNYGAFERCSNNNSFENNNNNQLSKYNNNNNNNGNNNEFNNDDDVDDTRPPTPVYSPVKKVRNVRGSGGDNAVKKGSIFDCTIPSRRVQLDPPTSCSSPKVALEFPGVITAEQAAMFLSPLTPITDDAKSLYSDDGDESKGRSLRRRGKMATQEGGMTPLTVDVASSEGTRDARRSQNPVGEVYGQALRGTEQSPLSLNPKLWDRMLGHEATIPSGPSPFLPTSSARMEVDSNPALEAVRRGKIAAMDMAAKRQQHGRVVEVHGGRGDVCEKGQLDTSSAGEGGDDTANSSECVSEDTTKKKCKYDRLAVLLDSQFYEVEQQMELGRRGDEDFSEIYVGAQEVVSCARETVAATTSMTDEQDSASGAITHQNKDHVDTLHVCTLLLEQALAAYIAEEEAFDYQRLLEKVIALRYGLVSGWEARTDLVMQEIALYIAAKANGLIQPDSPKRRRVLSSDGSSLSVPGEGRDNCNERRQRRRSGRQTSGETASSSNVGTIDTASDVTNMEECSADHGSLEVMNNQSALGNGSESTWSTEGHNDLDGGDFDNNGGRGSNNAFRRDDERVVYEEDSSGILGDVSCNATVNSTKIHSDSSLVSFSLPAQYEEGERSSHDHDYDPGEQILQGRPISLWTESEIQSLDFDSLPMEEHMVYAVALSRMQYEREQIAHTAKMSTNATSSYPADDNDNNDLYKFDEPNEDDEELANADYVPVDIPAASSNKDKGSSNEERDCGNFQKIIVEQPRRATFTIGSPDSKEVESGDTEKAESVTQRAVPPVLECEECLSDVDEIDGGAGDRLGGRKVKGKSSNPAGGAQQKALVMANPSVLSPSKNSQLLSGSIINSPRKSNASSSPLSVHQPLRRTSPHSISKSPAKDKRSPSDKTGLSPVAATSPRRGESFSASKQRSAKNDLARLRSPASGSPRRKLGAAKPLTPGSSASKRLSFDQDNSSAATSDRDKCTMRIECEDRKFTTLDPYAFHQDDLTNGLLGDDADPDGINGLLSPPLRGDKSSRLLCPRSSPAKSSSSPTTKSSKLKLEDIPPSHNLTHLAETGCIPVPVSSQTQHSGSLLLHNSTNIKLESSVPVSVHQASSPIKQLSASALQAEMGVKRRPTPQGTMLHRGERCSGEEERENVRLDCLDEIPESKVLGACKGGARPKTSSYRGDAQLDSSEEKENSVESAARSERLENIERGKADSSYRLVGIVNHLGESLFAGHYTAFAFNFYKQRWFYLDDKHTKTTTEAMAREESMKSGYVFFYMDKEIFNAYAQKMSEKKNSKNPKC